MSWTSQRLQRVHRSLRFYSLGPEVGPKFQTLNEVKKYVFRDSPPANQYLIESEKSKDHELPIPSRETVIKLLKLTGLKIEGADIEGIQKNLIKQISFISIIQKSDLGSSLDPKYARLLPRNNIPLNYEDLIDRVNNDGKNSELAENSETWISTSNADMSKNGYFVVREEVSKNEEVIKAE